MQSPNLTMSSEQKGPGVGMMDHLWRQVALLAVSSSRVSVLEPARTVSSADHITCDR